MRNVDTCISDVVFGKSDTGEFCSEGDGDL